MLNWHLADDFQKMPNIPLQNASWQLCVTALTMDQCGRFRSSVWCLTVFTSEICGLRHKSAAHMKNHRNHGRRQNSWPTPKFTVLVNFVNWWFSSSRSDNSDCRIDSWQNVTTWEMAQVCCLCRSVKQLFYRTRYWRCCGGRYGSGRGAGDWGIAPEMFEL